MFAVRRKKKGSGLRARRRFVAESASTARRTTAIVTGVVFSLSSSSSSPSTPSSQLASRARSGEVVVGGLGEGVEANVAGEVEEGTERVAGECVVGVEGEEVVGDEANECVGGGVGGLRRLQRGAGRGCGRSWQRATTIHQLHSILANIQICRPELPASGSSLASVAARSLPPACTSCGMSSPAPTPRPPPTALRTRRRRLRLVPLCARLPVERGDKGRGCGSHYFIFLIDLWANFLIFNFALFCWIKLQR